VTGTAVPRGIVISVFRGGCEVACGDRVHEVRLIGRHALREVALAVGDDVTFDRERGVLLDVLPRRTELRRRRPRDDPRQEQVIAANMDCLAIVASVLDPPFRPRLVDRFMLAALAGGLEAMLLVNKIDLLTDGALPDEVRQLEVALPVLPISARTGAGLEALRERLAGMRTVLAGHSGVGKSSLLNALQPELRLETRAVREKARKGRHTTTRATLYRLRGGAIVVDTPGIRELATGPIEPAALDRVYPDVAALAKDCRFRDCRHRREPDCAVRAAVERGALPASRYAHYRRLVADIDRADRKTSS
jgi:ribosome biogenesis GTPase